MLTEAFPKFENMKFVALLRKYFSSVWHVGVVTALMVLSALLSLEMPAYYCYVALTVLIVLFAKDALGIVPIVCCGYMSFSIVNNPDRFPETTILADPAVQVQIYFLVAVFVLLILGRLISLCIYTPKKGMPKLTAGFVLLGLSYILGGAFGEYYGVDTVLFGLVQFAAIAFFYFYFYYTIDWQKVNKGHVAMVFAVVGAGLVLQILGMYLREGVVVNGTVERGQLLTGWGHYNTVGCVMAMCIPAAFYFAATSRHGWIFTILSTVYMLAVVLTQSRGSILFGGVIFVVCAIVVLVKTKGIERILHGVVLGVVVVTLIVCGIVYFDAVKDLFASLFLIKTDENGRFKLFQEAWDYFLNNPAFGAGWGARRWEDKVNYVWFFQAHNTFLQLLGSLGLVGFFAYLVHRVQTAFVLFRRLTVEKAFIGLSIGALLLTCMMDCHIFSFGPAILYSILLVFMEGTNKRDGKVTIKPTRN